jgi:hypothetical protein
MDNRAVRTRTLLLRLTFPILLLAFNCLPSDAQATVDAIKARIIGQPLYLRGCWMDNHLKFNADGQPEGDFRKGSFTETGIDVREVKLSHDRLRIEGQRIGLEFPDMVPTRINIRSAEYAGAVSIEIQSPPNGDFSKALDAVFAPNLASLVPAMSDYWQSFARTHFLTPGGEPPPSQPSALADDDKPLKMSHVTSKPVVLQRPDPRFSQTAKTLKFSGVVKVHLWVMKDVRRPTLA